MTQRENYQMINRETFINGGSTRNIPHGNNPNSPLYIDDIDTDWQEEGLKMDLSKTSILVFPAEEITPRTMLLLIILIMQVRLLETDLTMSGMPLELTRIPKRNFRFGQNLYFAQSDETSGLRVSGIPGANPPFINDLIWAAPTIPV